LALETDRPRSIVTALALGAASSSCSYAAVALARSLFRKGLFKGEILVARATDPGWTPLFVNAGAIILEVARFTGRQWDA
jgi:uncharacterized protein